MLFDISAESHNTISHNVGFGMSNVAACSSIIGWYIWLRALTARFELKGKRAVHNASTIGGGTISAKMLFGAVAMIGIGTGQLNGYLAQISQTPGALANGHCCLFRSKYASLAICSVSSSIRRLAQQCKA